MKIFAPLLICGLFVGGCALEENTLVIQAPSGKEVQVVCPGKTATEIKLCQEAVRLGERKAPLPSTRMKCPESAKYYSLQGAVQTSSGTEEIFYTWDCNTIIPLSGLYDAVQLEARKKLGQAAGVSSYDAEGRALLVAS